ncbi:MAG: multidrug efflux SMR transporter [Cytophagaceae bacterium]|nr:multidrug efflux SMR transporter [Cytophagaceae bacterium]
MNWLFLTLAILTEVAGTILIKVSAGFTKVVPTVILIVFYLLSYYFFNLSLKKIEIGTAYAIWSGLGTVALAGAGIIFFREQLSVDRVLAIVLIIAGVWILNITGSPKGV